MSAPTKATVRNMYATVYLQNFAPKQLPLVNIAVRIRQHGLKYRVEKYIDGPIEGTHWQMISEWDLWEDAQHNYFESASGQHWEIQNEI